MVKKDIFGNEVKEHLMFGEGVEASSPSNGIFLVGYDTPKAKEHYQKKAQECYNEYRRRSPLALGGVKLKGNRV